MDVLNTWERNPSTIESSAEKLFLAMLTEIEQVQNEQVDSIAAARKDSSSNEDVFGFAGFAIQEISDAELLAIRSQCKQQQDMISKLQENNSALNYQLAQQHQQQQDMITQLLEDNSALKRQVKQQHELVGELREQFNTYINRMNPSTCLGDGRQFHQTQMSLKNDLSSILSDSNLIEQPKEIESVGWSTDEWNEQHNASEMVPQPVHSTSIFQDPQCSPVVTKRVRSVQIKKRGKKRIAHNLEDTVASPKNPRKSLKKPKTFSCGECKEQFNYKFEMMKHLRIHKGGKPYKCNECERAFSQSGTLKIHQRIHSGERPFHCTNCDAAFNQSGALKIHQRIHSGERPFHCTNCSATFTNSGALKIHQRIHSGEKPFHCTDCDAAFNQSSALKTHQIIHSDEKPFMCDVCKKTFRRKIYLSIHMRIHSDIKPHKCDICKKEFRQISNLRKHREMHA